MVKFQKKKLINISLIHQGKICPYCSQKTVYVDSIEVYGKSYGMVYLCRTCSAWVGVHKGTDIALGRLANSELRIAKSKAHYYFDKLWNAKIENGYSKNQAKGKAYKWLSNQLGIPTTETHIGWFDIDKCMQVINICKPIVDKLNL